MIDRAPFVRPSSLDALENCPGRALMEARAIAQCPSIDHVRRPAADQGTRGHAVIAQTLALIYHGPDGWGHPADALAIMAPAMEALEPWTRDAVRRCVAYAVALVDQAIQGELDISVQVEMHLSGKGIDIGRGGTADLILVCRVPGYSEVAWVIVADWKLGYLEQEHAADHLQLAAYAVMAWDKYQPKRVTVHLGQGRRQEFTSANYDAQAIQGARDRIKSAVHEANADSPELRPCIDACRYCKSILFCKPLRERIMDAADSLALFGADPKDRIKLAEDAALARRFAEDARELAKAWQAEIQSDAAKAETDRISK